MQNHTSVTSQLFVTDCIDNDVRVLNLVGTYPDTIAKYRKMIVLHFNSSTTRSE